MKRTSSTVTSILLRRVAALIVIIVGSNLFLRGILSPWAVSGSSPSGWKAATLGVVLLLVGAFVYSDAAK
jgi:hypothetical protein